MALLSPLMGSNAKTCLAALLCAKPAATDDVARRSAQVKTDKKIAKELFDTKQGIWRDFRPAVPTTAFPKLLPGNNVLSIFSLLPSIGLVPRLREADHARLRSMFKLTCGSRGNRVRVGAHGASATP